MKKPSEYIEQLRDYVLRPYDEFEERKLAPLDVNTWLQNQPLYDLVPLKGVAAGSRLTVRDRRIMGILLAGLVNTPIKHFEVLECYKSVYLVSFTPWGWIDPVMPVTPIPLGPVHNNAFRHLAGYLQAWAPNIDQPSWFSETRRLVGTCVTSAAAVLQPDEAQYYALNLLDVISQPGRV